MTKPASLITFLLDRSGSMRICADATIEAFNAYLAGLQAEQDAAIDFTFLQFDTISLDQVHVAVPVSDALPLNQDTFRPRGGTPLIDAAVQTIHATAIAAAQRTDKPRVVVCIQTDGEENSSRKHTWEELKALIGMKQEEGWQFNFMGAGIDAYQQAAKMGLGSAQTMSYDHTNYRATREAFAASASNSANYVSGRTGNTNYSIEQKRASGDKFDPRLTGPKS